MKQISTVFEYRDGLWVASCEELRVTLDGNSYDALVARMKIVIQGIVEVELAHNGDIKLIITTKERIEVIKATD